jgi:nicotinate dehydrogenase subunit B
MSISRRQFLKTIGSTGLLYAFRFGPATSSQIKDYDTLPLDVADERCVATILDIDYRDWIAFGPDGQVSIFTGRTELGQGLTTVLTAVMTQGLDIPQEKLTVILGDTELCPDDGPTVGSSTTKNVVWGFWLACEKIRNDFRTRASRYLEVPEGELEYRNGGVGLKDKPGRLMSAVELGSKRAVLINIDTQIATANSKAYVDQGILNVNAKQIVTGKLKYAGDIHIPELLYAGWLCPPYHRWITELQSVDLSAARSIPGVRMVEVIGRSAVVVAERYSSVLKSLMSIEAEWSVPQRPEQLNLVDESRSGAKLVEEVERLGDVAFGLAASDYVISETYTTQYTTLAQIETDTAIVRFDSGGKRLTAWVSSQYPFRAREEISKRAKIPEANIHVIAMPVGGGFGGKAYNPVAGEATKIARYAQKPVKLLYSRKDQIQWRGKYKEACVIDLTTGVSANGRILARKIDIIHDEGNGSTDTYFIPHVLTRLYEAELPVAHATSRGTSYVQLCYAIESHVDMVASSLGIDPVTFRRNNIGLPELTALLDASAEMIGYYNYQPKPNEGIGVAVVNHGGRELGAVAAEVFVDQVTGHVKVKRICGAFDIGKVINRNTATVGIRGAIIWGIGYALHEEIELNGHGTKTVDLLDYHIPRFSDIPPIEIAFFENYEPDSPRGCGEMPVVPTIGAIANAVYSAIGVRFYSTPITPPKVKEALQRKKESLC